MQNKQLYKGLTAQQIAESRKINGANLLTPPKKVSPWLLFFEKLADPLIVILLIAGVLSIGISYYDYYLHQDLKVFFEPGGIFVAILLATGLSFFFERKADKEFKLLNQVNDDEPVKTIRDSNITEVPRKDIVVGDIVLLNTGDDIPADGTLLEALSLHIDESTLTGEPLCEKTTDEAHFDPHATYPSNYVLRGTKVMEGHGIMRVKKVGDQTENGKVFKEAQIDNSVETPLNIQLDRLSRLISRMSYIFATLIITGRLLLFFQWQWEAWTLLLPTACFFYFLMTKFNTWSKRRRSGVLLGFIAIYALWVLGLQTYCPTQTDAALLHDVLQTIMIAVTLIVVSVPEGLPMAVTLSLAYSMRSMLKTNNLVRKLHACETMGATTIICTDKTGTLTENKMTINDTHFIDLPDQQFDQNDPQSGRIAEAIAVNSTASLDLSENTPKVVGNPTEGALLLWLHANKVDYRPLKEQAQRLDELPFSTEYKFMATIVQSLVTQHRTLYIKGAPERVYALSKDPSVNEAQLKAQLLTYQQQAKRTLGFASLELPDDIDPHALIAYLRAHSELPADCPHMHFQGFVSISDPVRKDVPEAVKACTTAGISIKVVTGDTPATAKEIARQIGLWTDADDATTGNIITGPEFEQLTDEQLRTCATSLKIIARARPTDKKRLVEALQANGEVVAVTGDGTNDAPALKAAHVGLSMGDGTSVAKEASDITIIDNSFTSIGRAVMWGRSLYRNIQRFLLFQLTVNVSACFIVLVGAFIGQESPLTVTQMLWVNLIMDTFGAVALASLPPSQKVMHEAPRNRNAFILTPVLSRNILGVGFFFFLMLLGLLFIFRNADIHSMYDLIHLRQFNCQDGIMTPYEQTLLFSIFVWTHVWYMFNAKAFATGGSGLRLNHCKGFLFILLLIVLGQIVIVEVLSEFFNVVRLSLQDWLLIVGLSSTVLWVREVWRLLVNAVWGVKHLFRHSPTVQ